ncbi:MAG: hypothetical protein ACMXYC_02720 [Candidatus Woesearchaeota archaeon]
MRGQATVEFLVIIGLLLSLLMIIVLVIQEHPVYLFSQDRQISQQAWSQAPVGVLFAQHNGSHLLMGIQNNFLDAVHVHTVSVDEMVFPINEIILDDIVVIAVQVDSYVSTIIPVFNVTSDVYEGEVSLQRNVYVSR